MCEVTIVIPNYKGKEYLFSCVKSLYEKDQTEKKILIIDNASNDGRTMACAEQLILVLKRQIHHM